MAELHEEKPAVEDFLSILVVQQQRIYDVLIATLSKTDESVARELIAVHEQMDSIGPMPYQVEDD